MHSVQCQEYRIQEYRIFNSGRGGILVCDSIESCLSIHRSAASFLSQYTGIIQEHAPKKTKCQKHKRSTVAVIDGNQEIGKSVANQLCLPR